MNRSTCTLLESRADKCCSPRPSAAIISSTMVCADLPVALRPTGMSKRCKLLSVLGMGVGTEVMTRLLSSTLMLNSVWRSRVLFATVTTKLRVSGPDKRQIAFCCGLISGIAGKTNFLSCGPGGVLMVTLWIRARRRSNHIVRKHPL